MAKMKDWKVLIAHSDEGFCDQLEALLERYTVRICREGSRAQEVLQLYCPDILVLDMLLPGMDGITLLQRAARMPAVIAMTGYWSEYMTEAAERMGISYLMRKPCSPEACAERVADLAQHMQYAAVPRADPRALVSNVLLQLGFSPKLKGYGFLREGILLFAMDTEQTVTKELYPAISRLFGSNGQRVERAIRSAIQSAWECGSRELWRSFFADGEGRLACPTNSEFIAGVTDRLIMEKEL